MAGLSTIIASYRKKVYANSIICLGFDPVLLVPVVRINEVLRGRWVLPQETITSTIFVVEAKGDTTQE